MSLPRKSLPEVSLKNSRKPLGVPLYANQLLMGEKTTSGHLFSGHLSDLPSVTQWSLFKHSWGAVGVALFRQARKSSE